MNKSIALLQGTLKLSRSESGGDILINGANLLDSVGDVLKKVKGVSDILTFYTSAMKAIGQKLNDFQNKYSQDALDAWSGNQTPEDKGVGGGNGGEVPFTRNWAIKQIKDRQKNVAKDSPQYWIYQKVIDGAYENPKTGPQF